MRERDKSIMARKIIIGEILNLIKGLGGNPNKFMGTKTNISFLGKGPRESLFQGAIDIEGMVKSGFPLEKVIAESEKAGGYVTSGKLNDLQLQRLRDNLFSLKQAYKPEQIANITDMATGTKDLTQEGLGSLRTGLQRFPKETHQFMGRPLKEADFAKIDQLVAEGKIPPGPQSLGFRNPERYGPAEPGSIGAKAIDESINAYPGLKYFESGELAEKTHSARATLLRMLDMTPTGKESAGLTLRELMSPKELKNVLEGGGGAEGDPIALIAKYFGPVVAKNIPSPGTPGVIQEFIKKIMRLKDRQGRGVEDPFFSKTEIDFAGGGLAEILQVPRSGYSKGRAVKSLMGLVNKRFGKDTLKKASDLSKGTKYEELEAVKAFEQRHPMVDPAVAETKRINKILRKHGITPSQALDEQKIIAKKYGELVDEDLLRNMLWDMDPQHQAEVMASIDEMLIMQNVKGMGPESIIETVKESWKRKPSASGGLAGILEV